MAASLWTSRCTRGNCSNVGYLQPLFTKATDWFGFPQGLVTALLIIEAVLAVVMEPLFGGLSDQAQRWIGSRFPLSLRGGRICAVHCNSCCSYLRQSSWRVGCCYKG